MKQIFIAIILFLPCMTMQAQQSTVHGVETCTGTVENAVPPLKGDGIADDTQAIQVRLDTKASVVYLPAPVKHYLISRPLRIYSGQTLKMDETTIIRLADNANSYMLTNADMDGGNRHIAISGGIWDGNNLNNACLKGPRNGRHPRDFYAGCAILLMNVENLHMEKMTVKDPERFGIHLAACRKFTVSDIVFDYNMREPSMDGVHLQGGCCEGKIMNLKGNTNDDMVALNSDDSEYFEITKGAITDIQIDGLWATNCFRGVRFLTAGTPVKRISISNIFGSFYRNAVAFTHWNLEVKGQGCCIEDVSVSNIFTAKVTDAEMNGKPDKEWERRTFAIIESEGFLTLDNLTFSSIFRREWMPEAAPTIRLQRGAKIGTLRLRDIQQINMSDTPLVFFHNDASIARLMVDGVVVREKTGAENAVTFAGSGTALKKHGEFFTEGDAEWRNEIKRVDEENKINPPKEQRL